MAVFSRRATFGSALAVVLVAISSCGGAASAPRAPARPPVPAAAAAAFSRDKLCPYERITLRERPDISTRRITVVGEKYRDLTDSPAPEIAADPERMRLWQARHHEADDEAARWHIEEANGCEESVVYACRTSDFRSSITTCMRLTEVAVSEELLASVSGETSKDAEAARAKMQATIAEIAKNQKHPLLRTCGGGAYELEVRVVGDCTLRMHGRNDTEEELIAELGHPCALPTRKSPTVAVPITLVAAKAELTGDLLNLKVSGKDPDDAPVTLQMTTRVERAPAGTACTVK